MNLSSYSNNIKIINKQIKSYWRWCSNLQIKKIKDKYPSFKNYNLNSKSSHKYLVWRISGSSKSFTCSNVRFSSCSKNWCKFINNTSLKFSNWFVKIIYESSLLNVVKNWNRILAKRHQQLLMRACRKLLFWCRFQSSSKLRWDKWGSLGVKQLNSKLISNHKPKHNSTLHKHKHCL